MTNETQPDAKSRADVQRPFLRCTARSPPATAAPRCREACANLWRELEALPSPPSGALTDAVPALVLLGAGLGLTSAPSQSAAMSDVPRDRSGMAAGLTSTMRYVGGIAGLTVLGMVLTDDPAAEVVVREHTTALSIFAAALILTLGLALLLPGRLAAVGHGERRR